MIERSRLRFAVNNRTDKRIRLDGAIASNRKPSYHHVCRIFIGWPIDPTGRPEFSGLEADRDFLVWITQQNSVDDRDWSTVDLYDAAVERIRKQRQGLAPLRARLLELQSSSGGVSQAR